MPLNPLPVVPALAEAAPTRRALLIELGGMLAVAALMTLQKNPGSWWVHYLVALTFTVIIWLSNARLLFWMQRRLPRPDQTLRRLLLQGPAHVLLTAAISLLLQWALVEKLLRHECGPADRVMSVVMSLIPTAFVALAYESRFFFRQWRANVVRLEQLARVQAQSQLDALRQQVDPHFLFNSLNTLAALIDDEPAAAQQYLSQLADVYRYVLLVREKDTVPLREELTFVDAYVALNKARFRDNLLVENHIPAHLLGRHVAPLSVQTLVENALKHNVISREHPLTLRLEAAPDGATISVANTVRPKATLTPGTRVGLRNLQNRYALLSSQPVEVRQSAQEWAVSLPLL